MRTIIDIPDSDIEQLRRIQRKRSVSRAELIREAVTKLVISEQQSEMKESPAFGVWKDRAVDGVKYQEDMRTEWGR